MNGSTLRKLMAWIKDGDNVYFNRSNVGIGLIAPTAKLHIKGDGSTAATFALKVENSSGSSLLSILNNGKIGVNKLTPAYELDIVGDLNFTGNLLKNGAAYNPGSQWQNNGANIYFNSGSVGIGTTNPTQGKLQIAFPDNIDADNSLLTMGGTTDGYGKFSFIDRVTGGYASPTILKLKAVSNLGTVDNVMVWSSNGNVGIGTTNPNVKLHVQNGITEFSNGNIDGAEGTQLYFSATGYPTSYLHKISTAHSSNTSLGWMKFSLSSGASTYNDVMTLIENGNVGIGITTPTAKLDINSDILRLRTAKTPATAGDSGNVGDHCWDAGFLYICTATNTWKRAAIATW